MCRTLRATAVAGLAAAALAAGALPAAAAGPAKNDPLDAGAPGGAVAAEAGTGFGRTPAGPRRLLVTFADTPRRDEAGARLGDIGAIVPVLPEAGVWSLTPDDPARARDRALARPEVESAEWSLARRSAERHRPPPPAPLGPPPAFTDPLFPPAAQRPLLARPPARG